MMEWVNFDARIVKHHPGFTLDELLAVARNVIASWRRRETADFPSCHIWQLSCHIWQICEKMIMCGLLVTLSCNGSMLDA